MNKRKQERKETKKKFKEWSNAVKSVDNKSCAICGAKKYIHAHHLFPREIHKFRFDVANGVSLCAKHHKYSYEISAHKNSIKFALWLQANRPGQWEWLIYNAN